MTNTETTTINGVRIATEKQGRKGYCVLATTATHRETFSVEKWAKPVQLERFPGDRTGTALPAGHYALFNGDNYQGQYGTDLTAALTRAAEVTARRSPVQP
jgi:hypothetical protein